MLVIDIETAPIDTEFTRALEPQLEITPYPAWNEETMVAYGNLVDPVKRKVKLNDAYTKWQRDGANHENNLKAAHLKALCDWRDATTINPLFSRVLAIGWYDGTNPSRKVFQWHADAPEEASVIQDFWEMVSLRNQDLAGWNLHGFDLPFLVERSQLLNVPNLPKFVTPIWKNSRVIDLMQEWNRGGTMRKLDHVARAMGLPGKIDLGTITRPDGLERPALPHEVPTARMLEYLERDVLIEAHIAHRLFPGQCLKPWPEEEAFPFESPKPQPALA